MLNGVPQADVQPEEWITVQGTVVSAADDLKAWGLMSGIAPSDHFPQSESTANSISGATGSFVLTFTRKSCGPSMPLCIMNSIESSVL
ncbi:MAG: hypothetical protein AUK03_04110 [Anaerolineae bacterium CG2_30_64_16]|nr:MAG: hypothetical protein AUK03_04110 [Anaerolineae bacterium CG2_30_64_16]